jgi:transposase
MKGKKINYLFCGVDIAKDSFEVAFENKKVTTGFKHTPDEHARLIELIHAQGRAVWVVCESSGGYERSLLCSLLKAGITVSLINPRWVRNYARSQGILAKTDTIDAQLLTLYGRQSKLKALHLTPHAVTVLRQLVDRRRQLLELIKIEKCHRDTLEATPREDCDAHLAQLQDRVKGMDTQIDRTLHQHPRLRYSYEAFTRVQGVGRITAITVLAHMPVLSDLTPNQACVLSGLAPYNHDSGKKSAPRSIYGGRKAIREVLYMAALTATQINPVLSSFYQRLIAAGKPSKVARVAVMRKLIRVLNKISQNPQFALVL